MESDPLFRRRRHFFAEDRPQLSELLWTLYKGADRQVAKLHNFGDQGTELQLFRNDNWYYGQRHDSRAQAVAETLTWRRQLEADGWSSI
jgi:hypothetical protein